MKMELLVMQKNCSTRIIRSHRRTLALVMAADATLTVRAPLRMPLPFIEKFIASKHAWIERTKKRLLTKPRISISKEQQLAYQKQAAEVLPQRVAWYAPLMGVHYSSIHITHARHRWGSCGPHGSLNFTWRLMAAQPEVIDYVVVHELAHIVWRGHGKRFWHKVASIVPDFKLHRTWLREHTIG